MSGIRHRPGALIAICLLFIFSSAALLLRSLWMGQGGVPTGDRVWQLRFEFQFRPVKMNAAAFIALPVDTSKARVLGQHFYYPGMRQAKIGPSLGEVHEAAFIPSHPGTLSLISEFQIQTSPTPHWRRAVKPAPLSADARDLYLGSEPLIQTNDTRTQTVFQQLFSTEIEQQRLLERIADFVEKRIAAGPVGSPADAAGALKQRSASALGRARAMVALCRAGKFPARVITGFVLTEQAAAQPHYWVEVFFDKKWTPFDPLNGHRYELPYHFMPVRRGGHGVIRVPEGSKLTKKYSITQIPAPHGLLGIDEKGFVEIFDLTRLPLQTQSALIILLMLPIGALTTTFARHVVGIRTFGVFTPTLLALATVYADWWTAAMIFSIVVVIGIGGRALLPGLKLMKIPRLSIVFTLVAVSMTFTVSALEHFNLNPAGHVVLLPMVVLTSIVDRVYSVADDEGMRVALLRLSWTIVIASCCVWLFRWQALGRLLLTYPELHFASLAFLLLLGLYNGKKLTGFSAFRFLTEEKKQTNQSSS